MQQGVGAVGGSQSQYGNQTLNTTMTNTITNIHGGVGDQSQHVEEASPISRRPPTGNFDELITDEDTLAAAAAGQGTRGVECNGSISGNRWPRQETLALIKTRSEMDQAFKDATLKGLLWEDVSRKLAELGYRRSAKKCKEKFENVHKYYKRTKQGHAGRQDGKSYKFFTELEALHNIATSTTPNNLSMMPTQPITHTAAATTNIGFSCNPVPTSSVRIDNTASSQQVPSTLGISSMFHPGINAAQAANPVGISFSSDTASLNDCIHDDDDEGKDQDDENIYEDMEGGSRKRRRDSSPSVGSTRRMMDIFSNLMRNVMQKQETMHQKFLEVIEKKEHDRMTREEAWKRQEMDRLTRENEIMAKERTIAAQRDAAIVSFLQKTAGQAVQLPQTTHVSIMPASASASASGPPPPRHAAPPPPVAQQHHHSQPLRQQQSAEVVRHTTSSIFPDVVMAELEQQVVPQEATGFGGCSGTFEPSSSRWPKSEVIALIDMRNKLEARYQEAGPKGPLWKDISAEMARLGYKRSAKKCKEKWENINKYYKRVKESTKNRPEDAKTCPYFHQLDELYRQKVLGISNASFAGSSSEFVHQQEAFRLDITPRHAEATDQEKKNGSNVDVQARNVGLPGSVFGEDSVEPTKKENS